MKKMTLTFEWIDNGRRASIRVAEREFPIKDEVDVKKDISAWVKEMYAADKGKHEHFEVCRKYGCQDRRMWVCYGTKGRYNWSINFMSWAVMIMACTMNYLGWERDIAADEVLGNGYTFVSSNGVVKRFKNLVELDRFIIEEMGVESRMAEIG